jgi:hypothetical protein
MVKRLKNPVKVLNESIRVNYDVLKGLNGGSKKTRKQ